MHTFIKQRCFHDIVLMAYFCKCKLFYSIWQKHSLSILNLFVTCFLLFVVRRFLLVVQGPFSHWRHTVGLSVKISSCKHLQKIFENWLVMRKSISRQQSLSFIDYIYLKKSKSYAGHMQAKLKQRKIILENFAALIVFFLKQREITQVNQQPTKD